MSGTTSQTGTTLGTAKPPLAAAPTARTERLLVTVSACTHAPSHRQQPLHCGHWGEEPERPLRVGSSRSVPAGPSRPSAAPRATLDSRRRFVQWRTARACSQSLTIGCERSRKLLINPHFSPGAHRSEGGEDVWATRLKPAPMLGLRRESGFGSEGRIRRMSVHLKLAQKVSLFC